MHRLYIKGDITVFWDSDRCYHAKKCVTGCPEVFDINRKPWIDLSRADSPKIWQTVSKCPSGALTCTYNHDVTVEFDGDGLRSIARYHGDIVGECDVQRITAPVSETCEKTASETVGGGSKEPVSGVSQEPVSETAGEVWNIYHTEVDPAFGGKQIAKRLVFCILEEADRRKIKVNATCSYAKKILGI